jgi:hypothetical protein
MEITARRSPKQSPKAMGHGLHGFSRIKTSKHIANNPYLPPSTKILPEKKDFASQ